MTPKAVAIPDFVPPGEMSVDDLLAAAIARGQGASIDLAGLLENVDVVEGRPLVDKASMIGKPHVVTSVVFRKGNAVMTEAGPVQRDYVSVEFTTVTAHPIEAVYNDGSTGIRRQMVAYLARKGLLPESYTEAPDTTVWVDTTKKDGSSDPDPAFNLRFLAPRGLRMSEYTNDAGESKTYYLA